MNCNKYKNYILLKSSGELSAKLSERLKIHLNECSDCRNFSESLNMPAYTAFAAEEDVKLHPSVMVNIRRAAEENLQRHKLLWLPAYALRFSAVAAIFMMIAGSAFVSSMNRRGTAERVSTLSTMVSLVSEIDENADTDTSEDDLEAIARQLLRMEGFDDEGMFDDEAILNLFGELPPTTTQYHKTPAHQVKRYVQSHQHNPPPSNPHPTSPNCGSTESFPA
jgi:hypothetical protein